MTESSDTPADRLWREYGVMFTDFDDLTLARWLAQTLGQLKGRAWRSSHPLVGAYRLAAINGEQRQIWQKRLATPPRDYGDAPCCRAPLLPLLTRDVLEAGLVCHHCHGTAVPFEEIPEPLQPSLRRWAKAYDPVHQVAHWDDRKRKRAADYEQAEEEAAKQAEKLLATAGSKLAPALLEHFPAVIWEDGDECLDVIAEDIQW